jgi:hypothetical protein
MYEYLIVYVRGGKPCKTLVKAGSIIEALGTFMDQTLVFDEVSAIVRRGKSVKPVEHLVRVSIGDDGKLMQSTVHPIAGQVPGDWPLCDCWTT